MKNRLLNVFGLKSLWNIQIKVSNTGKVGTEYLPSMLKGLGLIPSPRGEKVFKGVKQTARNYIHICICIKEYIGTE
jgi:hypothetical protein